MSAVVRSIRSEPPTQTRLFPRGTPVQLAPIPWGTRDPILGRHLCQHIEDTTPPTVVPFNPLTSSRLRRTLRSLGIAH